MFCNTYKMIQKQGSQEVKITCEYKRKYTIYFVCERRANSLAEEQVHGVVAEYVGCKEGSPSAEFVAVTAVSIKLTQIYCNTYLKYRYRFGCGSTKCCTRCKTKPSCRVRESVLCSQNQNPTSVQDSCFPVPLDQGSLSSCFHACSGDVI